MKKLLKFAKEVIIEHPELRPDIQDFVQLCENEIENGESSANEIELCYESIKQLIEKNGL